MVVLLLAIIDFSRVYTTMMSVESAAREAADFGTMYGAGKWEIGPALDDNVAEMQRRACVAASDLPDYTDSDGDPLERLREPHLRVLRDAGRWRNVRGRSMPLDGCHDPLREPPCTVTVTLDVRLPPRSRRSASSSGQRTIGFPSTITIVRDSTFAITDIDLSPTP